MNYISQCCEAMLHKTKLDGLFCDALKYACTNLYIVPTYALHQLMHHTKNHTNIISGAFSHGHSHVLRCIK